MKPLIAVIDYGMGNLHSVSKALEKAGGTVQITQSPQAIRKAAGVVLPGVGAFGEAIRRLKAKRLMAPIQEVLAKDRPFLGICLGLQLLFERSAESPRDPGLGFFRGSVERFRLPRRGKLKIPHMGWNTLRRGRATTPYLRGVSRDSHFYFVHSYYPKVRDPSIVAATTPYGKPFCSAVARRNLFACQFHPEKSGDQGQIILRNFIRAVRTCK
jgi:imidazole glycerol-phosphate synthase subunit HisH